MTKENGFKNLGSNFNPNLYGVFLKQKGVKLIMESNLQFNVSVSVKQVKWFLNWIIIFMSWEFHLKGQYLHN